MLTNIAYMFGGCTSLVSVKFGEGFDTSSVTEMQGMFSDCESLRTLDVSYFNTSNVTNMSKLFYNCKSLESIDLSNWDFRNVTDISEMFSGCENLKEIIVSRDYINNDLMNESIFEGTSISEFTYV